MIDQCRFLLRPVIWRMGLGILAAAAASLSSLGLMAAAAWLIASAAYQPALYELSLAILGVRVLGISRAVLRYGERYVTHDATFFFLSRLRIFVYRQLSAALPLRGSQRSCGELASLVVHEIETLKEIYLRAVLPLASACLFVAAGGAILWIYAPAATVLLLASFLVIAGVIPFTVSRCRTYRGEKAADSSRKAQRLYLDMIYGANELLAAERSRDMLAEADKLSAAAAAEKIRAFRFSALNGALSEAVGGVMIVFGLLMLIPLVGTASLSGVHFIVTVFILQSSLEVILPLSLVWHYYGIGAKAARTVFSLPEKHVDDRAEDDDIAVATNGQYPLLQLAHVSFSYDGAAVLKDVSFQIDEGERVAIVGASGAGKSTLFALLMALYGQEKGEMKLNGTSYQRLSPEAVRSFFRAVVQETHFFQRTIAENLRLFCPEATEAELWSSLEKAGLDGFVKALPYGLQTEIGQHGRKLSGGQRQRLALAAALLKPAPILLLDEPTRGLDVYTARQVRQTVFSLPGKQAIIYITHELADLTGMDRIIVLQDGVIAEMGAYGELMEQKGVFYRMACFAGLDGGRVS